MSKKNINDKDQTSPGKAEERLETPVHFLERLYPSCGSCTCSKRDLLENVAAACKEEFSVKIRCDFVDASRHANSVNVRISTYDHVTVKDKSHRFDTAGNLKIHAGNGKGEWDWSNKASGTTQLVFFGDDLLSVRERRVYNHTRQRVYPLTLKSMTRHIQANPASQEFFTELVRTLADHYMIMKDVLALLEMGEGCEIPVTIKEFVNYHNMQEFFTTHYKSAANLGISWNHVDPNIAYMALKTLPKLTKDSQGILLDTTTLRDLANECNTELSLENGWAKQTLRTSRDIAILFAYHFYAMKLNDLSNADMNMIMDWIRMKVNRDQKLSLRYTSLRRIQEEHDELAEWWDDDLWGDEKIEIRIPKNTRFKHLDEILPKKSFTKITTWKRLVGEGHAQHNCVASYADKINADQCAIYSATINNRRYTIEFAECRDDEYEIVQMYQACNRRAEDDDVAYVNTLLR